MSMPTRVQAEVRLLAPAQMPAASALLGRIWSRTSGSPVDAALLVALAHSGSYVSGAFLDERLVGVSVGLLAAPAGRTLHSHITGVLDDAVGRGVGRTLKEHQRTWCAAHGIDTITWTFDPLVRRNAYFNFHVLGVTAREYLVDFYGDLDDAINGGDRSDRLLVAWPVTAGGPVGTPVGALDEVLSVGADGGPQPGAPVVDAGWCALALPPDIEGLRRTAPDLARAWRSALREVLVDLLGRGWVVHTVDSSGRYLLRKAA